MKGQAEIVTNAAILDGPWPEIVLFITADGQAHLVPPLDGRAYLTKVLPGQLEAYEELARSGRLYAIGNRKDLYEKESWARQPWRQVLGLTETDHLNAEDVRKAFRQLAFLHHPDRGGSHEKMIELTAAHDAGLLDILGHSDGR